MSALSTENLCVVYGRRAALQYCTLEVPSEGITALVGANGSGKTTLLHCAVGLCSPSGGRISVLGGLRPGSKRARRLVAFVGQDAPLYRNLRVGEMVSLTQNLNLTFDAQWARSHLSDLGVFDSMRISSLSLGQQAQVSLALALARRPDLLILDEPLARLDPVARHDFVRLLLVATVEYGVAVLYSSHVVSELEDMADHIVVLNEGRVVVCDGVEEFLASHVILTGPRVSLGEVTRDFDVLDVSNSVSKSQVLALRNSEAVVPEGWSAEDAFLEELVLRYLGRSTALTVASPLALSEIPGGAR